MTLEASNRVKVKVQLSVRKQAGRKRSRRRLLIKMTCATDLILLWETVLDSEMVAQNLTRIKAKSVTEFWYSSLIVQSFPIKPATKTSSNLKNVSMFLAAIQGWFFRLFAGAVLGFKLRASCLFSKYST
jgi:hypothetical protein